MGRIVAVGLLAIGASSLPFVLEEATNPAAAYADSLSYPYPTDAEAPCEFGAAGGSSCTNPANVSDKYDWGVKDANGTFHPYRESGGYEYRNCTDYVAWRLESLGVSAGKVNGLGNGGQWYAKAPSTEQSSTPKPGEAAVVPTTSSDQFGHVAFVEAVNQDGTITVSEYNHDLQGHGDTRTGKPSDMGFTEYVDFGVDPAKISGGSSASAPNLYVVLHNNTSSGKTEVKVLDGSKSYHSWVGGWNTPDGTHSSADVDYGIADQNGDGTPDVYKIQHQNTSSGHTEVQVMDGANNNQSWIGGWNTPEGVHGANDVHYVVTDVNRDGKPDVVEIQDWNTSSGHIEVKAMDGANNNQSWIGGWATPEGWHGAADVDFVASTCGTGASAKPNIYEILHANTSSGRVEIKEFDGSNNYQSYVGGWTTPEGVHGGDDVNYVASGCNGNGRPNIYEVQHQNTVSGMTEIKEFDGSANYAAFVGGWTTPDGVHSGNDVDYVMPQ
ncbi:MAG TPA: CHAP domain-containing protein [Candidatus Saccharimonadales bacterium]|nr:CHAP domain-containing protein [Candidatus Saccharimonadales bacterium]